MIKKIEMLIAVAVLVSCPSFGAVGKSSVERTAVFWRNPTDLESRDLFYGAGGQKHQPHGTFRFVKEDPNGTNPKFTIEGQDGVKWKVKLGLEARPETAATRLLWAVGYFTDEDYLVPRLLVGDMPRLKRGQKLVEPDGSMRNARLERELKGEEKMGHWRWRDYRSNGRVVNGLRVMMALLNNWDLKDVNNTIYADKSSAREKQTYLVGDLGAAFGTPGYSWPLSKAKDNLDTYSGSKFITRVTPEYVNFSTPSRPALVRVVQPEFFGRLRMRWIGRRIPRADARWMGGLLGRLSTRQIRDAFRASGYSEEEVDGFTQVVQERIAELKRL